VVAPQCVLIGGGGHARVIIDALQAAGQRLTLGILDPARDRVGTTMLGITILGDDTLLPDLARAGTTHFIVAVGSVGDATQRRELFERACTMGLKPLDVRHPSAIVSRWATIGPGTQILPIAVVNAGARIGANVIINTGSIIEHDCTIGDHVHVATGARLSSTVEAGQGAHIGAGSVIRQGIAIGAGALVGAGAVVVTDVPPGRIFVGNPARELIRS
jgi:sugar O-acyltransferase (sialic acid O-acetyltransferase NeuD family)